MTVEAEAGRRRSRRIQDIQSSQPVEYDDAIDNEDYEGEAEDEGDVYEERNTRKRKASKQATSANRKTAKTAGTSSYKEQRDQFEEHYLFQALNDSEVSIVELATDWVDQYRSNKDSAKKDLINLILNAVGCFTKIEEHDVTNNESASETVGEIQTFFKRQKVHEFYLTSKKAEYKHLKRNFISFISQIIIISDEKGVLYESIVLEEDDEDEAEVDESNIMEDLLVWLSSFSVSSVRPLRYVSTLALLTMETTLCKTIKKSNASIEKFKHQLEIEKNKKSTAAIKKRITQVEANLETFTNQSTILQNFIQDIVNTTFIHRFKDVDHLIRVEAMSALGEWMDIYPELFFRVTYLKYLGWVLSDENHSVRLQVIKTLIKLLKQSVVVTGLRQFFERFKSRIVEIAFHDVDSHVRTNSIVLLTEIFKLGFLEEEEISKVSSLIFIVDDKKSTSLVATFIQHVEADATKENIESLENGIEASRDNFPFDIEDALRIHNLITILSNAHDATADSENNKLVKSTSPIPSKFATVGQVLFSLGTYDDLWESLIKYFLLDVSSVDDLDEELAEFITLTDPQESVLLDFIYGVVLNIKESEDGQQTKQKAEKDQDVSQKIISYLPSILKRVENNDSHQSIFIKLFTSFPLDKFQQTNQTDIFKTIYSSFLKSMKNNSIINLRDEYIILLDHVAKSNESTLIDEINTSFRSLISELLIEMGNLLKDSEFREAPNHTQLYEDYTFKLLILGRNYDISEIYSMFQLVKDVVLSESAEASHDSTQTESVASIFKLYLSATSWKLNTLLKTNELLDIEKELAIVPDLLEEFYYLLNRDSNSLDIRSDVAVTLIDLLIILKNFFVKYEESSKTNISNVNRFKDIELSSLKLDQQVTDSLLKIFLSKESIYGNAIDADLDRDDDEDVNFNSVKKLDDSEGETVDETKKWELEKDLVVFTAKLLNFHRFGFLDDKFIKRVKLNVGELGDLFATIVEDGAEDEIEEEAQDDVAFEGTQDDIVNEDDAPVIEMEV